MAGAKALQTNVGNIRTFTFILTARRTDGTWGPALLGVGATVKFVCKDLAGTVKLNQSATIVQDDAVACIVAYELDTDVFDLEAHTKYRVKLQATRAGKSKPESFPPGEDWMELEVGPDPEVGP